MTSDERDILGVLKAELDFIEKGGYGRSPRNPQQPRSSFRDSLTCINYASSEKLYPCDECQLIHFVPDEGRRQEVPCHFIQLNESGETVDQLEGIDNQHRLETALKDWLKAKIQEIEKSGQGSPEGS
jgi:hypothetical protein